MAYHFLVSSRAGKRMSNKFFRGQAWAKNLGKPCAYCKRPMSVRTPGLMPTRDHVHPRSKGGREIVWACDTCNFMKDDMLPAEWKAFMLANPYWWTKRKRTAAPKVPVGRIPANVPLAYPDNPMMQAGFERIYANRLYLLRVTDDANQ